MENVLLNKYLEIKVIDFGFSMRCNLCFYLGVEKEGVMVFCGTPTYMPPEIVSKKVHCPLLADRWSLGILLYTILHGHCPFKAHNQK